MIGNIICQEGVLSGTIINNGTLNGKLTRGNSTVLVGRIILSDSSDPYRGEYVVTPKDVSQILNTKDKRMTNDLTVKSIPYYNVSNPQGGETVIIGGEISWQ